MLGPGLLLALDRPAESLGRKTLVSNGPSSAAPGESQQPTFIVPADVTPDLSRLAMQAQSVSEGEGENWWEESRARDFGRQPQCAIDR
jgi:hypothetical protein